TMALPATGSKRGLEPRIQRTASSRENSSKDSAYSCSCAIRWFRTSRTEDEMRHSLLVAMLVTAACGHTDTELEHVAAHANPVLAAAREPISVVTSANA